MRLLSALPLLIIASVGVRAQSTPVDEVAGRLRQGGYVLVMRHASSPRDAPTKELANPDNVNVERQLDQGGRDAAVAMGNAIRTLRIPIGTVLTSPTYRARETVRLAGLDSPVSVPELGDGGQSMQQVAQAQAVWLRKTVAVSPRSGYTLVVTHQPNLARAFPDWGSVSDGETVIVRPDGRGGITIVGRIPISEWPRLR